MKLNAHLLYDFKNLHLNTLKCTYNYIAALYIRAKMWAGGGTKFPSVGERINNIADPYPGTLLSIKKEEVPVYPAPLIIHW